MGRLYVQLGRLGDILNLLPLLQREADSGAKPGLMVAREFSDVLEGAPYVEPHIYDGPYHEVGKACELAKTINPDWVCTQVNCSTDQVLPYVYGPAGLKHATTTSFQKESWRVAGKLAWWDDQPVLSFKRSAKREQALGTQHVPGGKSKKHVLFSAGGVSSPFPLPKVLRALLRARFPAPEWNLVDLSTVRAKYFYDLLALYERAYCLISADSAPLHLARACPELPVLALANDKPMLWHGSSWRPNHVFYCRYSDFTDRVEEFMWVLDAIKGPGFAVDDETQHIIHVWSEYDGVSRQPEWWETYTQHNWRMTPVELGACGRDMRDDKRTPYLKDCLRMGLQRAREGDLVCLTRPDTRFSPGLTTQLPWEGPAFAYRMNRKDGKDTFQPVADLFCAPKAWWREQLPTIPDLLLGKDVYWPHALWSVFHKANAKDLTGWIWRQKP